MAKGERCSWDGRDMVKEDGVNRYLVPTIAAGKSEEREDGHQLVVMHLQLPWIPHHYTWAFTGIIKASLGQISIAQYHTSQIVMA